MSEHHFLKLSGDTSTDPWPLFNPPWMRKVDCLPLLLSLSIENLCPQHAATCSQVGGRQFKSCQARVNCAATISARCSARSVAAALSGTKKGIIWDLMPLCSCLAQEKCVIGVVMHR